LESLGVKTHTLPLGVDNKRYCPCGNHEQSDLRAKYSLPASGTVLLHVGHIKRSRNIEWLIEVKRQLPDMSILVVGSTTTIQDKELRVLMENEGIIIIREYMPKIEELYQLADCYVFPVLKYNAAIETPLSVLEAMATNLPILTTRFGSLPDTFHEDECFKFISGPNDIVESLKNGFPAHCNNRQKIKPFTWEEIADRLHNVIYPLSCY
jgi:glycosyltransferase involved in cell wall biosynthesis